MQRTITERELIPAKIIESSNGMGYFKCDRCDSPAHNLITIVGMKREHMKSDFYKCKCTLWQRYPDQWRRVKTIDRSFNKYREVEKTIETCPACKHPTFV